MLYHLVSRSEGARAWGTWAEGLALFERVLRGCPGATALVVMPDHLHLLHDGDVRLQLARVLSADTRARRAIDPRAPGFAVPPAEALVDAEKIRRSVRYVHLNPCRAGLCADPLSWPLSTHRDAVGLALAPLIRPRPDAERFHAYVSADPHVDVRGTELPGRSIGEIGLHQVIDAVSALCRAPLSALRRRGPARTLFLAAARELTDALGAEIAARADVRVEAVSRARAPIAAIRLVQRVAGDPRFVALPDGPVVLVRRRRRS